MLCQVSAVNLALRSQDVALIHGPPGKSYGWQHSWRAGRQQGIFLHMRTFFNRQTCCACSIMGDIIVV